MRLDDEARGALERAVCGTAWVCMGFGIVRLGGGRENSVFTDERNYPKGSGPVNAHISALRLHQRSPVPSCDVSFAQE